MNDECDWNSERAGPGVSQVTLELYSFGNFIGRKACSYPYNKIK